MECYRQTSEVFGDFGSLWVRDAWSLARRGDVSSSSWHLFGIQGAEANRPALQGGTGTPETCLAPAIFCRSDARDQGFHLPENALSQTIRLDESRVPAIRLSERDTAPPFGCIA